MHVIFSIKTVACIKKNIRELFNFLGITYKYIFIRTLLIETLSKHVCKNSDKIYEKDKSKKFDFYLQKV